MSSATRIVPPKLADRIVRDALARVAPGQNFADAEDSLRTAIDNEIVNATTYYYQAWTIAQEAWGTEILNAEVLLEEHTSECIYADCTSIHDVMTRLARAILEALAQERIGDAMKEYRAQS